MSFASDDIRSPAFGDTLWAAIRSHRAYAMQLSHGDMAAAEDLLGACALKAWAHRDHYQLGTSLRAWTRIIVRNIHYSEGRRPKVWDPMPPHAEETLETEASAPWRIELTETLTAMTRLPDSSREALMLVAFCGLAYQAAGARLGIPAGTVKSRVSRSRDRLRELLEAAPEPPQEIEDEANIELAS